MSKRSRILLNTSLVAIAVVAIAILAAIHMVQTDWFRNYVKQKLVSATEESTGGRVEIASFQFDWRQLRVVVTGFVIHGMEPSDAAPFLRAPRIRLDLRLFTSIHHLLNIAYLEVDRPEANIVIFPDGRSNVPAPKPTPDNTEPLKPVVDAAVGRFELINGTIAFASGKQTLDVRGSNLRVQLGYSVVQQGYRGQIAFQPIYVTSGGNVPVNFALALPVTIQNNRIEFQNATISTRDTSLQLNGTVENLRDPKISAHINGHVGLADMKRLGNLPIELDQRDVPVQLQLDANATVSSRDISVTGLRASLGQSNFEASGPLKNSEGNGSLQFKTTLVLAELSRLVKLKAKPVGVVVANGTAKLEGSKDYIADGNVEAKAVSFTLGDERIGGVDLTGSLHLDPHNIKLSALTLRALGGEVDGELALQDFSRYQFRGGLRTLDLEPLARFAGQKNFPYDGSLSGPIDANGDLKATPPLRALSARTRLTVTPGTRNVPVSGRIYADYNGASDNLIVDHSYLTLPHTRIGLDGSVMKQLSVSITSTDLNDLLAATDIKGTLPVSLDGQQASFAGTVSGGLSAPRIGGHLHAARFSVEGRKFDALDADGTISATNAAVSAAILKRGNMRADFSANIALKDWQVAPTQPVAGQIRVTNGDLADVVALLGKPSANYSGALGATAQVGGTFANPVGTAAVLVTAGALLGEQFDRIQAQVQLSDQVVTIPAASIDAGSAHANLTAKFQHSRDSFSSGQVEAHLQTNSIDLGQLKFLQKQGSQSGGQLQANVDISGNVASSSFTLAAVNADVSARGLRFDDENYGDINATAHTRGQVVDYQLTSDFAGSKLRVTGNTRLTRDYPTTADATISSLPMERVLAVVRRKDVPVKGNLSGTAHCSGTVDDPQCSVQLDLTGANVYDEPIDGAHLTASYQPTSVEITDSEIAAGRARVHLTGRFDHPRGNFQTGTVRFATDSNGVDLARIHNVQKRRPGLSGTLQVSAGGTAEIREAEPRFLVQDLTANIAATGIAAQQKHFGDITLKANTQSGKLNFSLASDLAGSSIHGSGNVQLGNQYPLDSQLEFSNVAWTRVRDLFDTGNAASPDFDVKIDGQIAARGPVMDPDKLHASVQLSKLELTSIPGSRLGVKPIAITNQGPISATLDSQSLHIDNAHLIGPQTDIQAKGSLSLKDQSMDFSLNANADLGVIQNFDRDISSSGSVVAAAVVRGTVSSPMLGGQIDLRKASLNYAGFPNGIYNANGTVLLSGSSATVRNLTAESGGGKINLSGFLVISGTRRFGLEAKATSVRIRVEQGVSLTTNADLALTGTTNASALSGTATITRIAYSPQSDLGSLLIRAAPPVQASVSPSSLLDNMKLDVHVVSSDALAVQSSLAQSVQGQLNLRLRGTLSNPGVLGQATINEGTLRFFGYSYTVNSGTIGFYNAVQIEPILDISLETQAKGVDVTLRVTGPVDNMKLSYTSNPPLQFQEIIGLLAAGQTPTSDPTLLANQPAQPVQTTQQMGESALLGQALVSPAASRLQRVFGVSQLKIDPSFTSGSQLPTANLTLQQQVADNITFTYVSALDNSNATIVRVDFRLNQQWSAVAMRDQNGIVSVNLLYKRQIR